MVNNSTLTWIKILHTFIWVFFNIVLGYLFYAAFTNRITIWVWLGLGSFVVEGIILVIYKNVCPLTLWARRYSSSAHYNFDIYLPEWLARYNKQIYVTLLAIAAIILLVRVAVRWL